MNRIRYVFRQSVIALAVILLSGTAPAPLVFAETAPAPATVTSAPSGAASTGPTGADSVTYTFNASTGLWENDYYTYNPSTKETVPKVPLAYTYNPATAAWDTQIWQFNAAQQAYEQVTISFAAPPEGAVTYGGPAAATAATENTVVPQETSSATSPALAAEPPTGDVPAQGQTATEATTNTTNTEAQNTTQNKTTQNNTTNANLSNTIISNAASGNGAALSNDDVGGVASGNASAIANVVNLLQSQASFGGGGLATFTTNIQGNVTGDFLIDPASLAQPASVDPNNLGNATITNQTNGTITNDINLSAASGNALAENNDDVGSATSGNANAVADVINMINSVVAANQSFLGVINIYGDYTGNILMPIDSLNALLASGGNTASVSGSGTIKNDFTANAANNVSLAATTGNATAKNNDDVGSVTSGNGLTNLTILNLTGRQVVAANSLLVFVNVLGTWVGLIMDAPAGTTSAALGGGVAGNSSSLPASNSNISNTENYGITNNIKLAAASGDATAKNNDDVGSVTSGNATASANIVNLINSSFSLSNWFGILFINVFGNWNGNFGVMKPSLVTPITSGAAIPGQGGGSVPTTSARVFAFVPKAASSLTAAGGGAARGSLTLASVPFTDASATNDTKTEYNSGNILTAATIDKGQPPRATINNAVTSGINYWSIAMFAIAAGGFGLVGIDRLRRNMRNNTMVQG